MKKEKSCVMLPQVFVVVVVVVVAVAVFDAVAVVVDLSNLICCSEQPSLPHPMKTKAIDEGRVVFIPCNPSYDNSNNLEARIV